MKPSADAMRQMSIRIKGERVCLQDISVLLVFPGMHLARVDSNRAVSQSDARGAGCLLAGEVALFVPRFCQNDISVRRVTSST